MDFLIVLYIILVFSRITHQRDDIELKYIADEIGRRLWDMASNITANEELKEAYSNANLEKLDVGKIIQDMTDDVRNMISRKEAALDEIVESAQQLALAAGLTFKLDNECTKNRSEDECFVFKNASSLSSEWKLSKNPKFFNNPVNISYSTVHMPTDVYYGYNEIMLAISWSEELDLVFMQNYAKDYTLSYQYFAGYLGNMRIFPAVNFKDNMPFDPYDPENIAVDLYDARMRQWYIEAAADPKDIVILVDNSGSMMGQKREIARHTINKILETLGPNDFVNVFKVSDETTPVVTFYCNNDSETDSMHLVQASTMTVREMKMGIEMMEESAGIANFSQALRKSFTVLKGHRTNKTASMCNQAIMIITDGVPSNYREIFLEYNWNATKPTFPVRMFTYLIGGNGADYRETKWMACANRGYYVQLNTFPEVKEQILHYIHVLSRPLVLHRTKKTAWTSLYANKIDPKLTDWQWANELNEEQRSNTIRYRDHWKTFLSDKAMRIRKKKRKIKELNQNDNYGYEDEYPLMISLSQPAYDFREKKNITENVLINEAFWTTRVYEANISQLLGVAGTDIPVTDFERIMKPYLLGVNNYGFIVNNNGYIISHPDLRPVFQGILKPGFDSIDMIEMELLVKLKEPRNFDATMATFRDFVINQTKGNPLTFEMKYHYDNMRRVATGHRTYYIEGVRNTPLTMVLTVMNGQCSHSEKCKDLIRISVPPHARDVNKYDRNVLFTTNWKVHPKWFYCKYNYANGFNYHEKIKSPEEEVFRLLEPLMNKSPEMTEYPYRRSIDYSVSQPDGPRSNVTFYCDEDLVESLLYDANITLLWNQNAEALERIVKNVKNRTKIRKDLESQLSVLRGRELPDYEANAKQNDINKLSRPIHHVDEYNVINTFVATHSGLTRWKHLMDTPDGIPLFNNSNNRAIDEIWYKRAVELRTRNPESFVFSVPIDAPAKAKQIITASHAIFVKKDGMEAPAAVVGFQFNQSAFVDLVDQILQKDPWDKKEFYVLDNNAYIVASSDRKQHGNFFGSVKSGIMEQLVKYRVFKSIVMHDYQAVCFHTIKRPDLEEMIVTASASSAPTAAATIIKLPIVQAYHLVTGIISVLVWSFIQINVEIFLAVSTRADYSDESCSVDTCDVAVEDEEMLYEMDNSLSPNNTEPRNPYLEEKNKIMINRTRPESCDRNVTLYKLEPEKLWLSFELKRNYCFQVRPILRTNLVLLVITDSANCTKSFVPEFASTDPDEIIYESKTSTIEIPCRRMTCYSRIRPDIVCHNSHPRESWITLCGRAGNLKMNPYLLFILLLFSQCFISFFDVKLSQL